MKELVNESKAPETNTIDWDKIGSNSDVDELLKEYGDGNTMTVEPELDNTPKPQFSEPVQPNFTAPQQSAGGGENDPTDKRYFYVRGKKKGQRREKPYVQTTYTPPPNQQVTISGQFLTGALFLLLIDLLVPMLIGLLNERFSKTKIDIKKLKLTAEQKRELDPVADAVVKYINFTANPVLLLTLSLAGVYGLNYMTLIQTAKLEQTIKQQKNESNSKDNSKK